MSGADTNGRRQGLNPGKMDSSVSEQIAVTFSMTADDYARYLALARRLDSGWTAFVAYFATLFGAVPVALAFRSFGAQAFDDPAVLKSIGYSSLFAFMLGVFAAIAAMLFLRRIATSKALGATINAFAPKTAIFDASAITLKGQLSEASWRWAAVGRFMNANGLLLIWVGSATPVVIPSRSFGSDTACMAAEAFIRARMSESKQAAGPG
jgi:hypothetical protein